MQKTKRLFINNIDKLKLEGYTWEIISSKHTEYIINWRNDPDNLIFFDNQNPITTSDQEAFLKNYSDIDRVDFVLLKDELPVGVFNIKNLNTQPEYGALIGDTRFRGIGISSKVKLSVLNYWFNILNQDSIYVTNKKINKKVISSNLKLGFNIFKEDELFFTLKLTKSSFNKFYL